MNSDEFPTQSPEDPEDAASLDISENLQPLPDLGLVTKSSEPENATDLTQSINQLQQEIAALRSTRDQLQAQVLETQASLSKLMQDGLGELERRRQTLQVAIEQLERRQERIRNEMKTTFAGSSQEIAIRVQSFKDYLVGSLQDLALAAEQLELRTPQAPEPVLEKTTPMAEGKSASSTPRFAEQSFQDQTKKIRSLIDQFRNQPDYYGPVWKLRRTFEPIHAERASNWFFTQGGRGAVRSMGSRLQNILVASAVISILYNLYGDRLRTLILANSPERLGEWRRGLQDCLGVSRSDFGSDRGLSLFETPEPLALKADRLVKDGLLPLIVIDETEELISLAMLQFPMWIAFAPNPQPQTQQTYLY
ncbi:MAG: DUF3086 domain-containing protein [Leptolyngbyaceae cyanobacterium CSU_1_3]|nr:DUF3086 domain-containing protein [Leptolyngbyaceae cyanobacterium CSU_1_3]